ncbi:lipoprotein-releasing ABC transporter permease subunit [Spongiibacter taiwanensis]|uniref:lipoprotein-releasing ABC transporter permease subunit n=1 Tax=Spongiibacter taiwanensis TaxID=1748242 RepID=UPI002035EF5E|nr:lipoprotein-releasing ABC transporter permease subunit [Spongiibacter taiwanensis]USA43520.1 lipoprotein-releasing ABC transporter permease subunit [Spongiibacter taiwanensis]
MSLPLSLSIGIRYFRRASSHDHFFSLISWFSLLGMMLGVCALIIVMSVMNGFESELRQRVLAVVPHGYIEGANGRLTDWQQVRETLLAAEDVVGVAPYIGGKALLAGRNGLRGVALYGVDPELENSVSSVFEKILAGRRLPSSGGDFGIVMGDILARQLGVSIGDSIQVTLPKVTVTLLGLFPRQKDFTVLGVFSAGAQLDGTTAFIHIEDAQRLYQFGDDVEGLRIELSDMFAAPNRIPELAAEFPEGSRGQDWSRSQGSLFQAVKMEKTMVRLLLLFIILIAAFNIISILTMAVSDKRGAIAVLRTMGASPGLILRVFMIYGMASGILGVALGLILGLLIAANVGDIVAWLEQISGMQLFDPQVYFITHLPSELHWQDALGVSVAGLLLSFLATLYPAWQASKVQPAEALRYE